MRTQPQLRRARPRAEGVWIEPIAGKLADSAITGRVDQRLNSHGDETAGILMDRIFPVRFGVHADGDPAAQAAAGGVETLLSGSGRQEIRETFIPRRVFVRRKNRRGR